MKLYNLGKIPREESQLIYHALGYIDQEALSLVSTEYVLTTSRPFLIRFIRKKRLKPPASQLKTG